MDGGTYMTSEDFAPDHTDTVECDSCGDRKLCVDLTCDDCVEEGRKYQERSY